MVLGLSVKNQFRSEKTDVPEHWKVMTNLAMRDMLMKGEAIDVSQFDRTRPEGFYVLPDFNGDKDYCDAQRELWIMSIGQHKKTRQILASPTTVLFRHPDYECLFLR